MKKKILIISLAIFFIGIGRVNAKNEYVCYYDDKGYITQADNSISAYSHEQQGIRYYNCSDQKTMSMANTLIKMTVPDSGKVSFVFYDRKNSLAWLCFICFFYIYMLY